MNTGPFNTGQIVSGTGHVVLIGWALLGGVFTSEPLPFEVTEVTAISAEEYAALVAQQESPDAASDVVTPDAPEIDDATPDMAATPDEPPEETQPDAAEAVEPDAAPDVTEMTPLPEAEVSDEPPVLETPSADVAVLLPEPDVRPEPRPAPRVAPEPVAQPEPDVAIDDVVQEETTPSDDAEVVQEETEATSLEEATTEIVTEADEVANAAPSKSMRPKTRPVAAAQPDPAEEPTQDSNAVNDALAEALGTGGTDTTPEPTGPPLTGGEKDALRVAVERCWVVDVGGRSANVSVTVGVKLNRQGSVDGDVTLLSAEGGDANAQETAFAAARRAILRCQNGGYDLPVEKYDRWRDIEMTFNPEKMRIK